MTATTISPVVPEPVRVRPAVRSIPTARLIKVELRKMFNTRSGFWMLISIGVLSVIATGAVIIFAPDSAVTYENFATAIGFPMSVILPMIAILGVTSEWSQRSGLTTFTLVPSRGRVIGAKAIATFLVGLASMAVAFAVGAPGNLGGSALAGVDTVWDISLAGGRADRARRPRRYGDRLHARGRAPQLRGGHRRLLRRLAGAAGHPRPARVGARLVRRPAAVDRLELHPCQPLRGRHEHRQGVGDARLDHGDLDRRAADRRPAVPAPVRGEVTGHKVT
ncbi:hypothetical protein [Nocardioides sp. B-3]|uniref:hypothetical protein n=1 Tax=Nocardioides sp. B-3 TaxID=2895565 RepID=UPI002152311F|nr:hypothetical protein [Nocardioides sp. B-3]UUZ59962.1 hypothetical protein LP418_02745 [Nocardioides sp. B-3]